MDKEKPENFEVVEVAVATEPMIQNKNKKETYTITTALCKILNDLEEIKKAVV